MLLLIRTSEDEKVVGLQRIEEMEEEELLEAGLEVDSILTKLNQHFLMMLLKLILTTKSNLF